MKPFIIIQDAYSEAPKVHKLPILSKLQIIILGSHSIRSTQSRVSNDLRKAPSVNTGNQTNRRRRNLKETERRGKLLRLTFSKRKENILLS